MEGLNLAKKDYIIINMTKISYFVFNYNLKSQKGVYFLLKQGNLSHADTNTCWKILTDTNITTGRKIKVTDTDMA